jgi:mRNA interferase MazF
VVAEPAQGEVWWGEIAAAKPRPYLVLTRNEAIPVLGRIVVAPVTRTIRGIPTELPLGTPEGLRTECVASFDNVLTLPKSAFVRRMGALDAGRLGEPCEALRAALDC